MSALRSRSSSGAAADEPGGCERLLGRPREQPRERGGDDGGVGRPVVGVGLDQLQDQPVEVVRDAGDEARRRRRPVHPEDVLGLERPHAAQQLVERDAEREQVRARRRGLADRLLRGRVARRPGRRRRLTLGDRDAEVAQRGLALGVDPDVVGLDVAVDDAVRVGVGERVGDLAAGRDHLLRLQPPRGRALQPVGERATGHVARDQTRRARVLEDVVDGDDVAVAAEPRGQPRLTAQPLPGLGAGDARERHAAVERQVVGEPDVLARAAPELALQQVAPGDHPRRRGRGRGTLRRRDRARGTWAAVRGKRAATVRARGGPIGQASPVYGVAVSHPMG